MTRIPLVLAIVAAIGVSSSLLAQQRGGGAGQPPAAPGAQAAQQPPEMPPPLLFKEEFQQATAAQGTPTSPRRNPENRYYLAAQSAVKNANVELKLYGADAKNVAVYLHEGRFDLWTGLVGEPVAILLKNRNSFLDLTGLARVRAIVRTGNLHHLNPAIRLADGTLAAGDRVIETNGEFLQVDVSFARQRWYTIEPDTLAVKGQIQDVALAKVDEVGFVDLAPAGGHGQSGWVNISTIEVYAKPVSR